MLWWLRVLSHFCLACTHYGDAQHAVNPGFPSLVATLCNFQMNASRLQNGTYTQNQREIREKYGLKTANSRKPPDSDRLAVAGTPPDSKESDSNRLAVAGTATEGTHGK